MKTCREVHDLAGPFLTLDLPAESEAAVREHLSGCPECRDFIAAQEPSQALVWALREAPGVEDERFVGEVMAGIHQRRLEKGLGFRRRYLAVAAALLVAVLGGAVLVRRVVSPSPATFAESAPMPASVTSNPASRRIPSFVEVDKAGVRLYQLTPASDDRNAVQVAFIVDPHVEL